MLADSKTMGKQKVRNRKVQTFIKFIPVYLMALPGLAYLFINNYMPLPGLVLAFKKYSAKKGIYGSDWVGFKNFKFLFGSDGWIITRNTLLYNFVFIALGTTCAIAVAIILSEMTGKFKNVLQSVLILPHMISSVITSYLVYGFLAPDTGFVNKTILPLFGAEPIEWYLEKKYWPFIIVIVSLWRSVGYNCIVYLSTIMGFDRAFYEAATIDGAGKLQQIFKITLPLLKPTIIMLAMMSIGRIFYSDFGLFYQVPMNQGTLFPVTQTIDTYVYRGLIQLGNVALSAAAGFYQSMVGFVLVLSSNLLVRKLDRDSALF